MRGRHDSVDILAAARGTAAIISLSPGFRFRWSGWSTPGEVGHPLRSFRQRVAPARAAPVRWAANPSGDRDLDLASG
jgi:hypothetical protein